MRDLGSYTASLAHGITLTCHHCDVRWTGCMAESECPICGRPKGFHADDRDECYCDECKPLLWHDASVALELPAVRAHGEITE